MLLTTGLLFNAMRDIWRWPLAAALLASGVFLAIDLAFFGANLLKLREGGWIPLTLGAVIYLAMTTWRQGIDAIRRSLLAKPETSAEFLAQMGQVARVPGTAVFFSRGDAAIPAVLVRHVAQIKALQETVITVTVRFEEYPRVFIDHRAEVEKITDGFWHVTLRFGFIEKPNVAAALACAKDKGCPVNLDDAVYFASHDDVVRSARPPRMPMWRRLVFGVMYRNAVRAPDRFELPADKFLEVGRQIAL
jgi:KUP system potassium uptake protein